MTRINKRICDYCGNYYERQGKRYCSDECRKNATKNVLGEWAKSHIKIKKIRCKYCKEWFKPRDRYKKHCSRTCYEFGRAKKTKNCLICKREYIPDKGYGERWKNSKYCSIKCMGLAFNKKIIKRCLICQKVMKVKPSHVTIEKFCSKECYGRFRSNNMIGELNFRWNGGSSFFPYSSEFTKKLKGKIRKKYKYCCAICNKKEGYLKHSVHHIDYDKNNNAEKNLILLCKSCHSKTGVRKEYWTDYFLEGTKCQINEEG